MSAFSAGMVNGAVDESQDDRNRRMSSNMEIPSFCSTAARAVVITAGPAWALAGEAVALEALRFSALARIEAAMAKLWPAEHQRN
jgi:hypothetical protein